MEKPQAVESETVVFTPAEPIVIKTKKKKKFKYSRGLKDFQRTSRRMSKVSSRMARAFSKGIDTFRKESDKSARKKRDGAIRDFGLNVARGMSKSLRITSDVPYDLARAFDQRSSRRRVKRQIKGSARLARMMRIR